MELMGIQCPHKVIIIKDKKSNEKAENYVNDVISL